MLLSLPVSKCLIHAQCGVHLSEQGKSKCCLRNCTLLRASCAQSLHLFCQGKISWSLNSGFTHHPSRLCMKHEGKHQTCFTLTSSAASVLCPPCSHSFCMRRGNVSDTWIQTHDQTTKIDKKQFHFTNDNGFNQEMGQLN